MIKTAKPRRLRMISHFPWFRCALTKAMVLLCLKPYGVVRSISSWWFDLVTENSFPIIFLTVTILRWGAGSGREEDFTSTSVETRSCVERYDPRKRACGMTVAPRIPIARHSKILEYEGWQTMKSINYLCTSLKALLVHEKEGILWIPPANTAWHLRLGQKRRWKRQPPIVEKLARFFQEIDAKSSQGYN